MSSATFFVRQVAFKLASVELQGVTQVRLDAANVDADDQPAGLRAALPQITPLQQYGDMVLVLRGFIMQQAFAADLATAVVLGGWGGLCLQAIMWSHDTHITTPLPPLRSLGVVNTLTDQLLARVAACVASIQGWLTVPTVRLSASLPAGWPAGWDGVWVDDEFSVSELVRHAELLGAGVKWACGDLVLCLSPEEVGFYRHTYAHRDTHTYTRTHAGLYTPRYFRI